MKPSDFQMIGDRENPCATQADAAIIEAFKSVATSIISDNMSRLPGAVGIRPFHSGGTMAGTAVTVRVAPGDNLYVHKALELVRPGDVVVIDGGGDTSRALVGEIMSCIASTRLAAGLVVDGAIRDAGSIRNAPFPVFARAAHHKGPYKTGPGEINVPISIGGLIVEPGDIVVGDDDGVVAFSQTVASVLLDKVRAQEVREAEILQSIRDGTYTGSYGVTRSSA